MGSKPAAFFYLEEGAVDLHLYTQDLLEDGDIEMERFDYHEYVERRSNDAIPEGDEPVDIYMLAERYLEEHPVNAMKSELTDDHVSRKVMEELQRRKRGGEDIGVDDLAEELSDQSVTKILDMGDFRDRVAVQVGETSV